MPFRAVTASLGMRYSPWKQATRLSHSRNIRRVENATLVLLLVDGDIFVSSVSFPHYVPYFIATPCPVEIHTFNVQKYCHRTGMSSALIYPTTVLLFSHNKFIHRNPEFITLASFNWPLKNSVFKAINKGRKRMIQTQSTAASVSIHTVIILRNYAKLFQKT